MRTLDEHIAELETAIVVLQGKYHDSEEREDWDSAETFVYNIMLAEKDLIRCKKGKQ